MKISKHSKGKPDFIKGSNEIAIVGLGCRYPGSENPKLLWENILSRRVQFRRMPDVRLPLSEYQDNDRSAPDKTYGIRAAVIDGYTFDWAKKRIPKQTYEATDIAHWLALDVVLQMLEDAGYSPSDLPQETTQVVVGNTLTGEFTRSNTLRSRWPFVNKILTTCASDMQMSDLAIESLSQNMERSFKSVFPSINEDTLAGGLANTIAGRICNYLNLNGGGFVVDGACSSSLISIYTAATNLANGTIDFAIAGGVDISLDPFEMVGFAKTGALTSNEMSVYDKRGNGFIPGEGCGFVAMKRLSDAKRDGDKIYAVLDGWGMSSDGKGGITAPSVNGQSIALRRAYQQAGIESKEIDFIEGHGTGTTVGDKTELLGIAHALGCNDVGKRSCGVTSFKSIVGHTKAAAGVGAFIKTVIAVNQRVIPPTAGCTSPHEVFSKEAGALYPVLRGKVLPHDKLLRAGVSAMGFGGINLHVTLRSGDSAVPCLKPSVSERAAIISGQDSEVFCFAASSFEQLSESLSKIQGYAENASMAELADIAVAINKALDPKIRIRASIVARSTEDLYRNIKLLLDKIHTPPSQGQVYIDQDNQIAIGNEAEPILLGYVFPGQGSQRLNMARSLVERFEWADLLVKNADSWASEMGTSHLSEAIFPNLDLHVGEEEISPLQDNLKQTQLAQPAIVLASLLWLKFLDRLGLSPNTVLGHSLGELTAFYAAGAFDEKMLIQLATIRGRLMAVKDTETTGSMINLACTKNQAEELIKKVKAQGLLVIANINAEKQVVVSGEAIATEALYELATSEGVVAHRLQVSNAFHSPLVAKAAEELLNKSPISSKALPLEKVLISSCDGTLIKNDIDLRTHFSSQITRSVDFVAGVRSLQEHCDLVFEIGPGQVLSNLISQSDGAGTLKSYPVEGQAESFADLNWLIAVAHVHSRNIKWSDLYKNRVIRPFVPAKDLSFIVNPCERPFERVSGMQLRQYKEDNASAYNLNVDGVDLTTYFANRGDFIADVIRADIKSALLPLTEEKQSKLNLIKHGDRVQSKVAPTSLYSEIGQAHLDAGRKIRGIVADIAGLDVDSIAMSANICDDLKFDASKSAELAARISTMFNLSSEVDTACLSAKTLADFISIIDHRLNTSLPADQVDACDVVLRLAAEATGFISDQISLSMHLLDDLNLDSIKAGALIAQACAEVGVAGQLEIADLSGMTLGQMAETLNSLSPSRTLIDSSEQSLSALTILLELSAKYTGFPLESLKSSLSFADDLNLDSIKFAALVSEASRSLDIDGEINLSEVAQTTIEDLALKMQGLIVTANYKSPQQPTLPSASDDPGNNWVRSFEMQWVPSPLTDTQLFDYDLKGQVIAIQSNDQKLEVALALGGRLSIRGATVLMYDATTLQQTNRHDINHFVIILQKTPFLDKTGEDDLEMVVKSLRAAAIVSEQQENCLSLSYVQFDGTRVGNVDLNKSCASSFAASIHLERPTLNVRVLDFDSDLSDDFIEYQMMQEFFQYGRYISSRYDKNGQRLLPRYKVVEPQLWAPRTITWSSEDVVLVTGGAKGITAECALSFAKATGVRIILVGSSPYFEDMQKNSEIFQTLSRYSDEGLTAHYRQCDISDAKAVNKLINYIEKNFGKLTGLIHGAGINKPKRVENCSEEDAVKEIAPKLKGIINIISALDSNPPKLIVGLSSIIGITGMPGNSWYAFSNEALNLCLNNYQASHTETQIISLAYSVWAEVGMGAKMGSTAQLAKMGISAIPPESGVVHFMHSVLRQSSSSLIIIASRLGGLDTWSNPGKLSETRLRFIDNIVAFEPGVELINRVQLTLDDDLYLRDHYYRGVYLFPTVFGLEAMSQAVAKVLGIELFESLKVENVELPRPIIVPSDGGTVIQITAEVVERNSFSDPVSVMVGIRTQQTGYKRDHFSATFVLESQKSELSLYNIFLPESATNIDPHSEIYGGLLFQGPLFQRLDCIWEMNTSGSIINIERRDNDNYFASGHSNKLLLGDPSFRDVLLQSAQLSEKGVYLPVLIKVLYIYSIKCSQKCIAYAKNTVISRDKDELTCDVIALSEDRYPIEKLVGYRLKQVEYDENAAEVEDYVNPSFRDNKLLGDRLKAACDSFNVSASEYRLTFYPELSKMDRSRRRMNELTFFSEVISKAFNVHEMVDFNQIEVQWQENGKPILSGLGQDANISLSHDKTHCFFVAGYGVQGCDIEPIISRQDQEWAGLLGSNHLELLHTLIGTGDSLDQAGTRIWCTIESVKKAIGKVVIDIRISSRDSLNVLLQAIGEQFSIYVLTSALFLTRRPQKMVAMVVKPASVVQPITATKPMLPAHPGLDPLVYSRLDKGPQGQPKPCFRFRATFKDTTTSRHSLEFPVFANWMGNIRELGTINIANQLVQDFSSGKWGMVTNHSDIILLKDVHCLDLIEGRMYISQAYGKYNSSIDMHFEWLKINDNGTEELVATSNMATTWVEITGHGTVEVRPFPDYLQEFITSYLPKKQLTAKQAKQHIDQKIREDNSLIPEQELGITLYETPNVPKIESELLRKIFDTTSSESNLVGNIYFSNYYHWLKKLIDQFLFDISPELFIENIKSGEFHCLRSEIHHLREAMPFDKIEVTMALKGLYSQGIKLHFDFYKIIENSNRIKLAHGNYEARWIQVGNKEEPSDIPDYYKTAFLKGVMTPV